MSDGYWYCPHCQREVDGIEVTYQELHDDCGTPVRWVEPESPTYDQLKAERDRLWEEVKRLKKE